MSVLELLGLALLALLHRRQGRQVVRHVRQQVESLRPGAPLCASCRHDYFDHQQGTGRCKALYCSCPSWQSDLLLRDGDA